MFVCGKAAGQQVYPNSFKIPDDARIVQGTMLLYKTHRVLDSHQIFRCAPTADPNAVKTPASGHQQLHSVQKTRAKLGRLVAFLVHPEFGVRPSPLKAQKRQVLEYPVKYQKWRARQDSNL